MSRLDIPCSKHLQVPKLQEFLAVMVSPLLPIWTQPLRGYRLPVGIDQRSYKANGNETCDETSSATRQGPVSIRIINTLRNIPYQRGFDPISTGAGFCPFTVSRGTILNTNGPTLIRLILGLLLVAAVDREGVVISCGKELPEYRVWSHLFSKVG